MNDANIKAFNDALKVLDRSEYSEYQAMTESGFLIQFDNESNKTIWDDKNSRVVTVRTSTNHLQNCKYPVNIQQSDYDTIKYLSITTTREGLQKFLKEYYGIDTEENEEWSSFLKNGGFFNNHYANNYNIQTTEEGYVKVNPDDLYQETPGSIYPL